MCKNILNDDRLNYSLSDIVTCIALKCIAWFERTLNPHVKNMIQAFNNIFMSDTL